MKTLKVLGWILVVAGILDFALYYIADVDLTGLSFFPYVATGIGWALIEVAKKKGNKNEDEDDNQGTSDNGDSTKEEKRKNILGAVTDIIDDITN